MPSERVTENLTLDGMGVVLGRNPFGFVFEQGDVSTVPKLETCLKQAGGKPQICALDDYSPRGTGKALPEFIITFDNTPNVIVVAECKKNAGRHQSIDQNKPKSFAVDGVLYYAKFLKSEYNVIAVAVSGTKKENLKVSTFGWIKGEVSPREYSKGRDVLYSPENYLRLFKGETIQKAVSVPEIQELALEMHDALRELGVSVKDKPIFIAGILIALKHSDFSREYSASTSLESLLERLQSAIGSVLRDSDVPSSKVEDIKGRFKIIGQNVKLKDISLGHYNSLLWYVEELDKKIKPMMDYADSTVDALGVFYHEFVKYGGGGKSELGIVLTPQHLVDFMCELAEVNKNSRVVDICCGSASFLVSAMSKMFKDANGEEVSQIRKNALFGVEQDADIYTLAVANMIVRGDGKSNIRLNDCFKEEIKQWLREKNINVGLINPPYSLKKSKRGVSGKTELEFLENMLNALTASGIGVAVVPISCAIGTKFHAERQRLFKHHTMKAVFSMPDDIFHGNNVSANVCVMVWEAHKPHDSANTTFFGYYKEDGFVKAKKLGRIDKYKKWADIEREWLRLYREREVKAGLSAKKAVTWQDEWLCEAYMETDYSKLEQKDFQRASNSYMAYLIKSSEGAPDINLINSFVNISRTTTKINPCLDVKNWKKFNIADIFTKISLAKPYHNEELDFGGSDLNYITRTSENNGVEGKVKHLGYKVETGRAITVGAEGAVFFYQNEDFICGNKVSVLSNPKLNMYNGLFLTTVINYKLKEKFSYGRALVLNKVLALTVPLPTDEQGAPDWIFMESYIKALPYF